MLELKTIDKQNAEKTELLLYCQYRHLDCNEFIRVSEENL